MIFYRSNAGEWFGTQDEARKAAGKAWSLIDVPDKKEERLAWLNENVGPRLEQTGFNLPAAPICPQRADVDGDGDGFDGLEAALREAGNVRPGPIAIEEEIGKAEGNVLGGYALAVVCRVGEIKGVSLGAFRSWCKSPGRGAVDRGLLRIGAVALIEAGAE